MIKERFIALINKNLSGTATDTEKQLVEEYLIRLETNDYTNLDNGQLEQIKELMWEEIQQRSTRQTTKVVQMVWYKRKLGRWIAVAASIILVLGLGALFFNKNERNGESIAAKSEKPADSLRSFVHHEVNVTGTGKRIQLPDGSLIVLANNSELTYQESFTSKRDINLIGKAFFKVAKDKSNPFTVASGGITTTALGTEFTITAFANANKIVVRLYEGKVVVKPIQRADKRMKDDVYLLPGQEFVYGLTSSKVRSFKLANIAAPEEVLKDEWLQDNPFIKNDEKGSWYMFNNQSLAQVLDNLALFYNVKIVYDKKDVQNIYFTAKYNSFDSVEAILKRIGTLNNLTISKNDSAFILSK